MPECRYCANTGWFYSDPELGYCFCEIGQRMRREHEHGDAMAGKAEDMEKESKS